LKTPRTGLFITFEGGEGSGKSTHIKKLADFLRRKSYSVILLREPGSTRISEKIRKVLLDKEHKKMDEVTELFLYLASRNQLLVEKIKPALAKGKIVLCDRFHDATWVYQGHAGGVNTGLIDKLRKDFLSNIEPDLTIFLDLPVKLGLKRSQDKNRMEKKGAKFHRQVRTGYRKLAKANTRRFRIIKVAEDINQTQENIRTALIKKLGI